MYEKTNPSGLYIANNITINNTHLGKMEILHPMKRMKRMERRITISQWEEQYVAIELINISTTPLAHDN